MDAVSPRAFLPLVVTLAMACRSEAPSGTSDLERACAGGAAPACASLAKRHLDAGHGRIDKPKAAAAYARGCEAGDATLCSAAAEAYFWKDRARAEQLRQKACDLGSGEGCLVLSGYRREAGAGQDADRLEARGRSLHTKGCASGDAAACYGLGRLVSRDDSAGAEPHFRAALDLWRRRCDQGDLPACHRLGAAYAEETSPRFDPTRARPLLESTCANSVAESCAELGRLLVASTSAEDRSRGVALLEQDCRQGVEAQQPCREAAFRYVEGDGVPADKRRAAAILQNGCDLDDEWCCFKLGTMLVEGDGVPPDPARGAELTRSAVGLQFRAVDLKRGRTMIDPSLARFGMPESSIPPVTADPGFELILVALEVRRNAPSARLPVRRVFLIDDDGRRFSNHAPGDDPLGGKPLERREYMFQVPAETRPRHLRFELGTVTLDLSRLVAAGGS